MLTFIRFFRIQLPSIFIFSLPPVISNTASQFFGPLGRPRHPVSGETPALPYPSDIYTTPDSSSATGLRLHFPVGMIPAKLLKDIPSSLTPQTVFNGSDGFSAATSVLFELPHTPDLSTLPKCGGTSVVAFNLDTGEEVPIRVIINEYARSRRVSGKSQIVEIYPRARWRFKERYVVALTKQLKTAQKSNYTPTKGFLEAISNDGSRLANYFEPTLKFLEYAGIDRKNLISATFFTIRSEQEVTEPMKALGKFVYEKDHPVRKVRIKFPSIGRIGEKVHGEVLVHDFRNEDGGIDFDASKVKENWIRFRLTLPRVSHSDKVPIAIYGHGLTASKKTDFLVSIVNATMGIATISINHPNHGSRIHQDGGHVLTRLNSKHVPLQLGMMAQSPLDFMSLFKAVKSSIAAIQTPKHNKHRHWFSSNGSNKKYLPEIDTENIFYQGTSLGGVLGSTFVSLAPGLRGAFLHVSGVGITNILSNSTLWSGMFSRLIPKDATGAEAMILKSAIQHELDYCDAINFAHYFRNPPEFSTAKPVAIAAGLNDGIVPNLSTVAMAEIAQIPIVGKALFPIPGVDKLTQYDKGYGVTQVASPFNAIHILRGIMAHISFIQPEVYRRMKTWTHEVILDQGK